MCIKTKDVNEYKLIMAKMSKHEQLSVSDKEFMHEHGLQQKYNSYVLLLNLKERFYGSNVSS